MALKCWTDVIQLMAVAGVIVKACDAVSYYIGTGMKKRGYAGSTMMAQ
jgi:hypothetical protein